VEVLSFEMLNNSFKVIWLANLLSGKDTNWNTKHVFNLMGGPRFLLKCDSWHGDVNGNPLTYTDYLSRFNLPVSPKEYTVVLDAFSSCCNFYDEQQLIFQ